MPNIVNSPSPSRTSPSHPTTPKGRHQNSQLAARRQQRKTQSMSPQSQSAYASSSICASPSARNVPMPPIEWLNQLQVPGSCDSLPSRPSSSISMPSNPPSPCPSSTDSHGSVSPLSLAKQQKPMEHRQMTGVRVCPLQLIAAVASA